MRRPALALALAAAVLATTAGTSNRAAPAAPTTGASLAGISPSMVTRSYYMGDGSARAAGYLGCANGDKQGRMTLFFGSPTTVSGTNGATLWGAPNKTTAQIAQTVKEFARGYVWCRRSRNFVLLIGVGTSTSNIDWHSDGWLQGHGRAWAAMAKGLNDWARAHYPGRIRLYGAWDAEPSWSTYAKAEQWMRGYDGYPGRPALHANNSADGCPQTTAGNGSCNNGWTQRRVWRLAWNYDPALPIPQIYATSGANARQWHQISRYGASQGDVVYFYGTMSQRGACRQVSSGCYGADTSPERANAMLLWAINSTAETHQDSIDTATDIRWHS
jgi:hypothetical protein